MADGILLFGASQRTGLEVAKILVGRGEAVAALVRPGSDTAALEDLGVTLVRGDAMDAEAVDAAFAAGRFRAAISTIGGSRREARRPDFETTKNMTDAAARHGVRRLLLVTMIGAGDSRGVLSEQAVKFLGAVADLKTRAEEYLLGSGLDATVLRPGGMLSEPHTGTAIKTEDHTVMGMIHRADLAALVVRCLDDDATIGRIYHTVDPCIEERPPLQRGVVPRAGQEKP
ncbi:MAG: NAD(P)H-binding protein [Gammaproteobacteria bacterium]